MEKAGLDFYICSYEKNWATTCQIFNQNTTGLISKIVKWYETTKALNVYWDGYNLGVNFPCLHELDYYLHIEIYNFF